MRPLPGLIAVLVTAVAIYGLVSCSSTASPGGSSPGKPVYGGTLRVISNTGPGTLDPVPTYNYAGYELERGYTRQLVTYPTTSPAAATGAAWAGATALVPDVAMQVPTAANGGITNGGLVYTYVPACTGTRPRRGR
jgi:peptide/nickel transport system substrate-binding protein